MNREILLIGGHVGASPRTPGYTTSRDAALPAFRGSAPGRAGARIRTLHLAPTPTPTLAREQPDRVSDRSGRARGRTPRSLDSADGPRSNGSRPIAFRPCPQPHPHPRPPFLSRTAPRSSAVVAGSELPSSVETHQFRELHQGGHEGGWVVGCRRESIVPHPDPPPFRATRVRLATPRRLLLLFFPRFLQPCRVLSRWLLRRGNFAYVLRQDRDVGPLGPLPRCPRDFSANFRSGKGMRRG